MVFKYTAQTLGCLYISRREKKEGCFYLPGKFFFERSCLTKATEKIIINLLQTLR